VKVTGVRLARLRVPLRTPFKTALRIVEAIDDVVVTIDTDTGHVGWGEAPPTAAITGETHESIVSAIRGRIAPRLVGVDIDDLPHLAGLVAQSVEHNGSAKAAVEIALYDLHAQLHRMPLYRLLGGGVPRLTTDITISVDEIDKMVSDALEAVERGFAALKVKVGKDIDVDIERVRAVHAAVRGRATLRLDANQGWTAQEAVRAISVLEDAGVELDLVEQPVPARDVDGLEYVTRRVSTPVMADESVFDLAQAAEVIRRRAADIVNIKLMKTGGITGALAIADLCAAQGVECMMGCMLETSISVAAAAHVAVARSNVITRVDLDGPQLGRFDPVVGGAAFDGPAIVLDEAPGLGILEVRGLAPAPA
jgi:L-alanine-DL-glutamate epimerase-like enolase superfamily enzyme